MRLLFICDEYPPLESGGYAQLCFDLAHELGKRDHSVTILCEKPPRNASLSSKESEPVIRNLVAPITHEDRWPIPFQQLFLMNRRIRRNKEVLKEVCMRHKPEVILFWPNYYLDTGLMHEAESMQQTLIAYYLAGISPFQLSPLRDYWNNPGISTIAKIFKTYAYPFLGKNIRVFPLKMEHVICVSEHERQRIIAEGVPDINTVVIYNGIDLNDFQYLGSPSSRRGDLFRVLFTGRLFPEKGAHTLIEAIKVLREHYVNIDISATILGAGKSDYIEQVKFLVSKYSLKDRISLRDWIPRNRVSDFMSNFDVLVLPTIHPEPLSRNVQEAMALGLVVIATPTGGTVEIVHDGVTGLTFEPENSYILAERLVQLYNSPYLCDQLSSRALGLVKENFSIHSMANKIEKQLSCWKSKIS
jgi:glycosyltransferase involved in cell wall biosynthesis